MSRKIAISQDEVGEATATGVTAVEGPVTTPLKYATPAKKKGTQVTTVPTKNSHEDSLVHFLDSRYESADPFSNYLLSDTNVVTDSFNYILSDLKPNCPPEDVKFFQTLNSIQQQIISVFNS